MNLRIGPHTIDMPDGHSLPQIYAEVPTYDFLPWQLIGRVVKDNGLHTAALIDIGSNIGDTVAHFRLFSAAKAYCVEADPYFVTFLRNNVRQFDDVQIIPKLACPRHLVGKVQYARRNSQTTGSTVIRDVGAPAEEVDVVTIEQLIDTVGDDYIFKTDTDGFDAEIIADLLTIIAAKAQRPPIIFFEGANAEQMISEQYLRFVDVTVALQNLGYSALLLANSGLPLIFANRSEDAVRTAFEGLALGYAIGRAPCHYFDILAVRADLDTRAIRSRFRLVASMAADPS